MCIGTMIVSRRLLRNTENEGRDKNRKKVLTRLMGGVYTSVMKASIFVLLVSTQLWFCSPPPLLAENPRLKCDAKAEGVYRLMHQGDKRFVLLNPGQPSSIALTTAPADFADVYLIYMPRDGYHLFAISTRQRTNGLPGGLVLTKNWERTSALQLEEWAASPNDQKRQLWCFDSDAPSSSDKIRNYDDGCLTTVGDGWTAGLLTCPSAIQDAFKWTVN